METRSIDWDAQPLGQVPDVELAVQLGVSNNRVARERKKRGIAKARIRRFYSAAGRQRGSDIDWDAQPLGQVSDVTLARELEVSPYVVFRARKKRDVVRHTINRTACGLGAVPDAILAQRLNVTVNAVSKERRRRGLPAARSKPDGAGTHSQQR